MTSIEPPQSLSSERQVIAAVFNAAGWRDDLFGRVRAEDFYLDAHQRIWRAAAKLHAAGHPPDLAAVAEELTRTRQFDDIGGPGYLAEVWACNPTGIGWEYYAAQVLDAAGRRRLIHACTEAARDAFDGSQSAADLLAEHERRVFALGESDVRGEPVPLGEALREAIGAIDDRLAGRGERPVPTGFQPLDQVVGGFRRGQLVVVAARPSVGKSAIALGFALNALRRVPALFFSQEMSRVELANRVLALRASVPLHAVDGTKALTDAEVARLLRAADEPTPHELLIDDRSHLTAAEVTRSTRRAIRRHGVQLVVVDYLQRMSHDRRAGETTTRQVGDTAKQMKTLARTCDVPVICLAQLNREVEGRGDGRPKLSDLRDSGEIEQEADVVMLLHPHPPTPGEPGRQQIDVLVEKQRNGPKSTVSLDYRRPFTRFEVQGRDPF
jgi:replicative DNA helicase